MTVPGKGGRPRKWRSDADRVRAYRARQQGAEEPPLLAVALNGGDGLARAWDTIRLLRQQLGEARSMRQQLQKELRATTRKLEQQHERFGWIEKSCALLRVERDLLITERDELRAELGALCPRIGVDDTRPGAVNVAPAATTPQHYSRSERRRLEREQRSRGRNN